MTDDSVSELADEYRAQKLIDSNEQFRATINGVGITKDHTILLGLRIGGEHIYSAKLSSNELPIYFDLCDMLAVPYRQPNQLIDRTVSVIINKDTIRLPALNSELPRTEQSPNRYKTTFSDEVASAIIRRVYHDQISTGTITNVTVDDDTLVMTIDWYGEIEWTVGISDDMGRLFETVVEEIGGGDVELISGSTVAFRKPEEAEKPDGRFKSLRICAISDPLGDWLIYPNYTDAQEKFELKQTYQYGPSSIQEAGRRQAFVATLMAGITLLSVFLSGVPIVIGVMAFIFAVLLLIRFFKDWKHR